MNHLHKFYLMDWMFLTIPLARPCQADRDGDGLINPDEFYRVMRKSGSPGDHAGTEAQQC